MSQKIAISRLLLATNKLKASLLSSSRHPYGHAHMRFCGAKIANIY